MGSRGLLVPYRMTAIHIMMSPQLSSSSEDDLSELFLIILIIGDKDHQQKWDEHLLKLFIQRSQRRREREK